LNRLFDKEHRMTNGLMVIAIVLLVLSLLLSVFVKPPVASASDFNKAMYKDKEATKTNLAQAKVQADENAEVTWPGTGIATGPAALAFVTKSATKRNVKLMGFRNQRVVDAGEVTQQPFLINAEGAYKDVMAFESDIEAPKSKLAVENMQLGSSAESTDQVTATISVETYTIDPVASTTSSSSTTSGKTTAAAKTTTTTTTTKTVKKPATPPAKAPVVIISGGSRAKS